MELLYLYQYINKSYRQNDVALLTKWLLLHLNIMMKRENRNKAIVVWALLLCFMSINIVKAIHVHNADGTIGIFRTDAGQTDTGSDDDNNCPICHFSLFPFIESPTYHITFSPHLLSFLLVCPLVVIEKRNRLSSSSRAPPMARLS